MNKHYLGNQTEKKKSYLQGWGCRGSNQWEEWESFWSQTLSWKLPVLIEQNPKEKYI